MTGEISNPDVIKEQYNRLYTGETIQLAGMSVPVLLPDALVFSVINQMSMTDAVIAHAECVPNLINEAIKHHRPYCGDTENFWRFGLSNPGFIQAKTRPVTLPLLRANLGTQTDLPPVLSPYDFGVIRSQANVLWKDRIRGVRSEHSGIWVYEDDGPEGRVWRAAAISPPAIGVVPLPEIAPEALIPVFTQNTNQLPNDMLQFALVGRDLSLTTDEIYSLYSI